MARLKCTIYVKDEVNCSVLGLDPEHTEELVKKFSILVPGRFHMAKFKLGVWDGTIAFFKTAGETYVNLLDDIVPILERHRYKIEIVDDRKVDIKKIVPIDNTYLSHIEMNGKPIILHDHQVDVINALTSNGFGIGKAATGAGKTLVTGAMTLIHEALDDLRVLTIVPNKTLVKQTYADYVMLGIDSGIYYGEEKHLNHKHLVSTWQSLIISPTMIRDYDVVIVDEVHGAKGQSLQTLLLQYGGDIAYRYGVTGTMPKEEIDLIAVKIAIGDVQVDVGGRELIDKGLLANLNIHVLELEHNLTREYDEYKRDFKKSITRPAPLTYTKYKDGYLPDYATEKAYNTKHHPHLTWIAKKIEEIRNTDGNVLILVDGVKHGETIHKLIDGSYFLSGADKVDDRKAIYDQYTDRDDMITIATAQIASTGLSIKRIFALVYINFGKSGIKVIQSVGRGLRTDDDKNFVNVYDIYSDMKFSRRHSAERIKFYKEEKYPYTKQKIKFAPRSSDLFD